MADLIYGGIAVAREGLDIVAEEAARIDLPAALLVALAYGESSFIVDWPGGNWRGDGGQSVNWYQVNRIHPGWPDRYLGYEGIRSSIRLMSGRWRDTFAACGGWRAYAGLAPVPDEASLPPPPDTRVPLDPTAPRLGRAAFLYHWWPRAQGSIRPTWPRALVVDAVGSAVWEYYQDLRLSERRDADTRLPHLIGALDVARTEVRQATAELDAIRQRLAALAAGIDQSLS